MGLREKKDLRNNAKEENDPRKEFCTQITLEKKEEWPQEKRTGSSYAEKSTPKALVDKDTRKAIFQK